MNLYRDEHINIITINFYTFLMSKIMYDNYYLSNETIEFTNSLNIVNCSEDN